MRKILNSVTILLVIITLSSCSGVKVLTSWKSDTVNDIKDNNMLVIARTDNKQARIAFEQEISNQLRESGMKATESFREMPNFSHEQELTDEQKNNFRQFLDNEGYDGVVLTVIKDYQESTRTTEDGGFYAGATFMPSYYPSYYGGFYGYYSHPLSYSTYGTYVPRESTTYTVKTFILETVAYDLTQEDGKQLAVVVTSQIEDPKDVQKNAEEYTKKITDALRK